MSLSDLKKKKNHYVKKKSFTIDEFISDAENYAKGAPSIVSGGAKSANIDINMSQAILMAKQHLENKNKKHNKPFRRATFTLSEDAIEQLTQLSAGTDLAKSHIIRILINELCNQDQRDSLQKLLGSHTD
ncbi:MAG: hypothetical protein JKX78_12735 [Alteromonadaceae bacterium]|nr:hypothetical protein [Alteromonadaceae bacterium]